LTRLWCHFLMGKKSGQLNFLRRTHEVWFHVLGYEFSRLDTWVKIVVEWILNQEKNETY
jgi:hypothetical protein